MDEKTLTNLSPLDAPAAAAEIEAFLQERLAYFQRKGAVVALSGGLDSAVTAALAVRALGVEKVTLLNLPERDSDPVHRRHARMFAGWLGAKLVVRPITPVLRAAGTYRLLPLRFLPFRSWRARMVNFGKRQFLRNSEESLLADRLKPPQNDFIAKGNAYAIAKHRIRMVMLYQVAEVHTLMVVGAANRTEWLTGTFSKWGVDHCADVMPVVHLFRSQVEELAEYLKLPEYLLHKAADPDVMPGVNNKGLLLGDFGTVDQILSALEHGENVEDLKTGYDAPMVDRLFELWQLSAHMRESPYTLGS
ncbi:MAG: NAD(+) synthase [Anaerolineales bacterium]